MRSAWLLRDGRVLAAAEVACTWSERARGVIGRPDFDGAMVLDRVRAVHTAFLRCPLDVAFLDTDRVVIAVARMEPWRVCRPRLRARSVVEAPAGAFERWGLRVGDRLEIREVW
ncbi:MAG TPA: DUF192 domain-containing protein [Acidimicrobiales bacterium]|nr:DUF192 domain-containing protein [Acidimicrobiales bacterium]